MVSQLVDSLPIPCPKPASRFRLPCVSGDGFDFDDDFDFDFDIISGNDCLSFVSCFPSILQFEMSSCCQPKSNMTSPDNIVGIVNAAYSTRAREGVTAACESCPFLRSIGLCNYRK